jgi:hypothetical protein
MDSSSLLSFELLGLDHRLLQVLVYLTGQVHVVSLEVVCLGNVSFRQQTMTSLGQQVT